MGPNEERVREEMYRDADIARGLGGSGLPGLEDMRYYGRALDEAVLSDSMRMACGHANYYGEGACPVCGYEPEWMRQERLEYRKLDAELMAHAERVENARPMQSRCRGWVW